MTSSEPLSFDVVIIGAGPAGLATALALLEPHDSPPVTVCLLEKASRIGGHLLSGAIVDPMALADYPWAISSPVPIQNESWQFLTAKKAFPLYSPVDHRGHFLVSLGRFCRDLAARAEQAGAMLFPGFAGREWLFDGEKVVGVRADGADILGRVVVLAEGCRGHLTREIIRRFHLDRGRSPQTHALGFKELWSLPGNTPGEMIHTLGFPFSLRQWAGGFLHTPAPDQLALGMVFPLDYANPWLDPYRVFQQWKGHPFIGKHLENGSLLSHGARTLCLGGIQALPELVFPGGILVGDAAGFLDPVRLRGIGPALASGKIAGRFLRSFLASDSAPVGQNLRPYQEEILASDFIRALRNGRNIRPAFQKFGLAGTIFAPWEWLARGHWPWTLTWNESDSQRMRPAKGFPQPNLAPLGRREDALFHAALSYPEGAGHIRRLSVSAENPDPFAWPETRFCPAGVFRQEGEKIIVRDEQCLHCKTCDIKSPGERILWTPPHGGGGPDYRG